MWGQGPVAVVGGNREHRPPFQRNGCDPLVVDALRDGHIRARESRGDRPASPRLAVRDVGPQAPVKQRRLGIHRALRVHHRLQRLVLHLHLHGTVGGLLKTPRQHQGHRLAYVVHAIDGQPGMVRHRAPFFVTGKKHGLAEVAGGHDFPRPGAHPADPRMGMRTAHHHRVPDAWDGNIVHERSAADQQIGIFDPFDAGSTISRGGHRLLRLRPSIPAAPLFPSSPKEPLAARAKGYA